MTESCKGVKAKYIKNPGGTNVLWIGGKRITSACPEALEMEEDIILEEIARRWNSHDQLVKENLDSLLTEIGKSDYLD
ncbi:MAG: hypothetical protein AAF228_13090 [Pseudomonadota bacterium]